MFHNHVHVHANVVNVHYMRVHYMRVHYMRVHYIIIPDILSPKTTRAFWRQNNFNINKPAPLGATLLGAFHWKCSTPFYS
jgi:hypothetical protein